MTSSMPSEPLPTSKADLQSRAARGVLWTGVHTLISLPVAFLVNLVLARVLGAADYGRLALLTALLDIASVVVGLGVGTAVMQFGSKAHAMGNRDAVKELLSRSQGFRLLWTAPVVTVVVLVAADAPPGLMLAALLFGIWLPAATSGGPTCLALENRTDRGAQVAMVTNLVLQTAVVLTVLTIATPDAVWLVRLVVGGASAAATLLFISPDYRRAVLMPRLPRGFPPGFWRFALPTGLSAVIGTLVASRTEVFFLDRLATAEQVGIFALAYGLAGHLFAPVHTLMNPLIPAISGLREVDAASTGRALARALRVTSTTAGLMVASGLPALALLIPVLYGSEFSDASAMFVVLGGVLGVTVLGDPLRIFVLSRLRGTSLLTVDTTALVVAVVAMVATIPFLGAWGAVAAKAASSLTQLALLAVVELRGGTLGGRAMARAVAPSFVAIAGLAAGWMVGGATPGPEVLGALVAAVVGAAVLVLGLWLTRSGLTPGDGAVVLSTLPLRARSAARPGVRLAAWARDAPTSS